jgi:hypothetical protein
MAYRFDLSRIHEIVRASKGVRQGNAAEFRRLGGSSAVLAVELDLLDGPFLDIKLIVTANDVYEPESYHAALILDGARVRGIDFSPVGRRKGFKIRIPKGWHENVEDPNLPKGHDDQNRHVALADFDPTDLADFLRKVTGHWNIETAIEPTLF